MERDSLSIEPYRPQQDAQPLYALWQATLEQTWPITYEFMQAVLNANEAEHFVVRLDKTLVGFVATGKSGSLEQRSGHLELLLVAPEQQGQGIGTLLHDFALERLRQSGIHSVQLGAVSPRFWFAVPHNLSQAVAFFAKRGWDLSALSYDLVRSLKDFVLPEKIRQRMKQEGIEIVSAHPEQVEFAVAFEEREFPYWSRYFKDYAALGDVQDLLLAWNTKEERRIVGTLVLISPQSHPQRPEFIWKKLLGKDMGGMMAVGVAESERGRGIGIALVAYGGELLRMRGVDTCLIDWVVLTDFYGKLGWQKWRAYHESRREI